MIRDSAARVNAGLIPTVPQDAETFFAAQFFETQKGLALALAVEGFKLANSFILDNEMGLSLSNEMITKQEPGVIELEEGILVTIQEGIEEYLRETSKLSAKTYAKEIDKIVRNAQRFVDPDTGIGLTARQIAAELLKRGFATSKNYATLVARTSTMWALNFGSLRAYSQAGFRVKEWLTTFDDLTCEWCLEMDGKKVRTEDPFWPAGSEFAVRAGTPDGDEAIRVLDLPFAVHTPPLHPYCRCTLLPVTL